MHSGGASLLFLPCATGNQGNIDAIAKVIESNSEFAKQLDYTARPGTKTYPRCAIAAAFALLCPTSPQHHLHTSFICGSADYKRHKLMAHCRCQAPCYRWHHGSPCLRHVTLTAQLHYLQVEGLNARVLQSESLEATLISCCLTDSYPACAVK